MSKEFIKKAYAFLAEKKRTIIIIVGLAGIALIFVSGLLPEQSDSEPEPDEALPITAEDYRKQLENELAAIISRIDGAGEVSILITMETTTEDVYAVERKTEEKNSHSASSGNYDSDGEYKEENKYVTIKRKDGSEETVLQKQIMPKIRGVLVVCDGGGNSVVKEKITQAVSGVLNISGGKVFVTD